MEINQFNMKKLLLGLVISTIFFLIALLLFNDISFPFLGTGIIILGINIFLYINKNQH